MGLRTLQGKLRATESSPVPKELKTEADVGDITADIERLPVLNALVKTIGSDMDKLIKQIKAHMAVTGETRIEVRSAHTIVFRTLLLCWSDIVPPLSLLLCPEHDVILCTPTHPPASKNRPARAT